MSCPEADSAEEQAELFRALASESRVRILQLLAQEVFCVNALARRTGISAGAVSQHLRVLKSAGLVLPERRGYFIHYRLAPDAGRRLGTALAEVLKPLKGAKTCAAKSQWVRNRKT